MTGADVSNRLEPEEPLSDQQLWDLEFARDILGGMMGPRDRLIKADENVVVVGTDNHAFVIHKHPEPCEEGVSGR